MNTNNTIGNKGVLNKIKNAPRKSKILGVLAFLLLLALSIYIIFTLYKDYKNTQSNEPWLIPTTKLARTSKIIPGYVIKPSNDSKYGIEFTYALWIYVTDWTYKSGEYKHIFHKGNATAKPLQAPGVWLYPKENKIAINMNTYHSIKETCDIGNIPIGKWFHLTISVIGKNIDVYLNGRLKKRCKLIGIPKQNLGDLYINAFNGFDGFISKFKYFNYAIPYYKIEQMLSDGPSRAPCVDTGAYPPYLSRDYWFGSGFPNAVGFPLNN